MPGEAAEERDQGRQHGVRGGTGQQRIQVSHASSYLSRPGLSDADLYIKLNLLPGCFATGLPASQAAVIAATQRPLAAGAFTEPSGPAACKTIPSWAVIGTGDRVNPPAELTFMAQRAGAHITEVKAGHLSLIPRRRS